MAIVNGKSGTFNISTENTVISGYVKWQETYDDATYVQTNKTKVTLTAYLHRTNIYSGPTYIYGYSVTRTAYFGDEVVTETSNPNLEIAGNTSASGGPYTQVFTATKEITHNTDGSKSLDIGFYMTNSVDGVSGKSFRVSKTTSTVTLTTIPRGSTVTNVSGTTIGGETTVTLDRKSSNYTHQLWYKVGESDWYDLGTGIGTSKTFTIDIATANQFPNSMSGNMQLCVRTFNGTTQIGSDVYSNVTVYVPDYSPTISNIALTGEKLLDGAYVQGKSRVVVDIIASSLYGATIKTYSSTIDDRTYWDSNFKSSALSNGSKTVSVTVTDTRGKTATLNSSAFTVYAYANPNITEFTLERQADGTTVIATVKGTVSAINNKNTKTITVTLNKVTQTITSSSYTINGTTTFTNVPTDNTLTATAKIQDSYTSDKKDAVLLTVSVTEDYHHSGKGKALGKVAEWEDFLDLAWNLYCRKNVSINNEMFAPFTINRTDEEPKESAMKFVNSNGTLGFIGMTGSANGGLRRWTDNSGTSYLVLDTGNCADYIVEQGTSDIWTYRKWNSGDVDCWCNKSVTPTTVNGTNSIVVDLPFAFKGIDYKVDITPAKTAMYIGSFGDCATNGNLTHSTTNFTMSYKYNNGTAYAVSFNLNVHGKWK